MKNRKGFVFIETIVMIVILAVSLLVLYNSFSSSINDEKKRLTYDDVSYIYRNYYILDFLLSNSNIASLMENTNNSPYYIPIGTETANLFTNTNEYFNNYHKEELSYLYTYLHVSKVYLVSSKIVTSCYNNNSCFSSLNDNLLKKYLQGMDVSGATNTITKYYLVVEYNEKYNSSEKIVESCAQRSAFCKSYFASLEITEDMTGIISIDYENCPNPQITNYYFLNCDENLLACKVAQDFNYIDLANSKVVLHNGIVLDSSCNILDAEDESYRYTGGDYQVTQKAINAGYNYVTTYRENTTQSNLTEGVIGVNCNGTNQYFGYYKSDCSTKYYYLLYDTNVTQYSTYQAAINKAISDGYVVARYLNNYVCFGYDRSVSANNTTCPEQNLYRIIGAFDDDKDGNYEIKLLRNDYMSQEELGSNGATSEVNSVYYTGYKGNLSKLQVYYWNGSNITSSDWSVSTLRTVNLNDYYVNNYLQRGSNGNYWSNMIKSNNYYLAIGNGIMPKQIYNNERDGNSKTISDKIGLLSHSDYAYSNSIAIWNNSTNAYYYAKSTSWSWMYNGYFDAMLYYDYQNDSFVSKVMPYGSFAKESPPGSAAVRVVLYLKPNVEVINGTGASNNPYYIQLT